MIDSLYLWLKALHIISVIAWMAGLLYLPRLFVYHAQVAPESEASQMLKTMERKLLRSIMNPAMIATLFFGLCLIVETKASAPGNGMWLHAKLLLVAGLFACHGIMAKCRRAFANNANTHSARYFRILNEIPAVLMIGIVFLAVVKPF